MKHFPCVHLFKTLDKKRCWWFMRVRAEEESVGMGWRTLPLSPPHSGTANGAAPILCPWVSQHQPDRREWSFPT